MTVFGPRCLLEASKSPSRASQEPAKSFPRGSQSLQKALHSLQEPPVRPPRRLQEPALQTFLHSLTEDTNPKASCASSITARPPSQSATHSNTLHAIAHSILFHDAKLYICMPGLYICTGHRIRSGRGHSGQAGCQRPGVCMGSSGSAHEGLLGGLYTLTSSHPLDLQQIGTRREGKNLRLSQLEPKWHHDPGGSVYQLTHADSLIYKHISHTLNVTLRLNY